MIERAVRPLQPSNETPIGFILEPISALSALEAEWRALEQCSEASFFTSWHWIGTLLDCLPPDARPRILRGVSGARTVALALLGSARTRRLRGTISSRVGVINATGAARFDCITIEHNGLIAAPDFRPGLISALAKWVCEQATEFDELILPGCFTALDDQSLANAGARLSAVSMPSYSVDLQAVRQPGGLAAGLSRNARSQLRRAVRKFESIGPLSLETAGSVEEALAYLGELEAMHSASWRRRGKRHSFESPFFKEFVHRLITRCHSDGTVQVLRAAAGSTALGYLLNFRYRERVYAYQSGFADSDPHFSPGMATHFLAIESAAASGAQVYDFMAGRNRLKERFSTHCAPMFWYNLQRPLWRFRLEDRVRLMQRRLNVWLASRFSGDVSDC